MRTLKMAGILTELLTNLIDSKTRLSDCLTKAYIIARKLKITESIEWISNEKNGYADSPLPDYRQYEGNMIAHHIYYGWKNVVVPDEGKDFCKAGTFQSISELESMVNKNDDGYIIHPLPSSFLQRGNFGHCDQIAIKIEEACLQNILDTVRQKLIDWVLHLQEHGIEGEGLAFTKEEKEKAMNKMNLTINLNGNGPLNLQSQTINSNQMQVNNNGIDIESFRSFIQNLDKYKAQLELSSDKKQELEKKIIELKKQIENPKETKSSTLKSITESIKNILENASGSIIASGLLNYLPII